MISSRILFRLMFFLCCNLLSVAVMSEVYSWTDEDGNIHFSDAVPPQEVEKSQSVTLGKINAVTNTHTVRTLEELKAAGIEITPELRAQAHEEQARRDAIEQEKIDALYQKQEKQAQQRRDEQQTDYDRAVQARQDQAVSDTCGRRSASSREKQRCIDAAKKVEAKCTKRIQSERQKDWCERNYDPSQYH